jgi:hypothetical protein
MMAVPVRKILIKSTCSSICSRLLSQLLLHITFLFYNAKISDHNAESGKVPRMLAAFPR